MLTAKSMILAATPNPGHDYTDIATGIKQGELFYGANNSLLVLSKSTSASRYLANTGSNNDPAWSQVNLNNGVSNFLLPNNGGLGIAPAGSHELLITNSPSSASWQQLNTCLGYNKGLVYYESTQQIACNYLELYSLHIQARAYNPARNTTVYFGGAPIVPNTNINIAGKILITKPGTIVAAALAAYSATAGTNQNWSMYIRVNNSDDYLIETLGVATTERAWINSALSIPVNAGDYINIMSVHPNWGTVPGSTVYGGHILVAEKQN